MNRSTTRRWIRRGVSAVAAGALAWLVMSYFYLGPWLPGVLAAAVTGVAVFAMARDAGPLWAADRWPLERETEVAAAPSLPTDPRTRRLRRLCSQVSTGAATDAEVAELTATLQSLAPGRPLPDVRRMDLASLARIVTQIEEI